MSAHALALLLLGSPRPKGASAMILDHLETGLERCGVKAARLHLTGLLDTHEGRVRLLQELGQATLCVLACPVYVDAPPAPVVRALEFMADAASPEGAGKMFAAVSVCGFPESSHNAISLDMYRLFARTAGLTWAGGLAVGGGGALGGQPLEDRGPLTKRLRAALDACAQALSEGRAIPAQTQALAAMPGAPRRLYTFMASLTFIKQAHKRGALFKLGQTPFAPR